MSSSPRKEAMKAKRVKAWAIMRDGQIALRSQTNQLEVLQCRVENNWLDDGETCVPITILVPYRPTKRRKKK